MIVRLLEQTEHGNTRALYEEVFSEDSKGFVDYYYTEKTKDNQIYVIEEDGMIVAMLHLNPYELSVNGSRRLANYIVAVATKKEYRSRGYMATLLKQAINDMYEAGQNFTFLMPAAEAIYTPHDFRTVYEATQDFYKEDDESLYDIKVADESEMESLADAANAELEKKYQVYAIRSKTYYERMKNELESDGAKLMIYQKNQEIVDCKPQIPGETSMFHRIMVRILDVRRMLMAVKVKSLMAVAFTISDPIIAENNRHIVMTGTEFSGLMLMDTKPENCEGTITIAALASFLFGAKSVEEICEEPGVIMSDRMKSELQKMIPLSTIYLNEIV